MNSPYRRLPLVAALSVLVLLGCGEGGDTREITKKREVQDDSGLRWKAPGGWKQGPEKQMRLVTFLPEGRKDTECYITILGGRAGGTVANINRWLGQMGRPSLTPDGVAGLPDLRLAGRPGKLVEATGTFLGTKKGFMLLGAVSELPQVLLTIKMTGPESDVRAEKQNFLEFARSLR